MYDVNIDKLRKELDLLPEQIGNESFLNGSGLGNEIPFWIFHYPAEHELFVRSYFPYIEKSLSNYTFKHLNIFQVLIDLLDERKLLDRIEAQEKRVGHQKLKERLSAPLSQDKIARFIESNVKIDQLDFMLISGLGAAWPLLRGHELLSALQDIMRATPLVLFYPGDYDGRALSPFGMVESNNYYRAFSLNPSDS